MEVMEQSSGHSNKACSKLFYRSQFSVGGTLPGGYGGRNCEVSHSRPDAAGHVTPDRGERLLPEWRPAQPSIE